MLVTSYSFVCSFIMICFVLCQNNNIFIFVLIVLDKQYLPGIRIKFQERKFTFCSSILYLFYWLICVFVICKMRQKSTCVWHICIMSVCMKIINVMWSWYSCIHVYLYYLPLPRFSSNIFKAMTYLFLNPKKLSLKSKTGCIHIHLHFSCLSIYCSI